MAADAAASAAEATAAATRNTEGAVDGAAAYAAALDAARKTGVDEGTAKAVATKAVASVAPEVSAEPTQPTASSTGPSASATGEPESVAKPSRDREPVAESARESRADERVAAGEGPVGVASRNKGAARDEDSTRDGGSDRGEYAGVGSENKVDGKLDVTVLPITDGDTPAGGDTFGVPFAPLAAVVPVLLALLVAAGLLVHRLAR